MGAMVDVMVGVETVEVEKEVEKELEDMAVVVSVVEVKVVEMEEVM